MSNRSNVARPSPIRIVVVGHTNTGKTSLIRTLLRDDRFGEINDAAGTTRYVEKAAVFAGNDVVLNLFDTPGLEDSSALLQTLEELDKSIHAGLPAELLSTFIAQAEDFPEFAQETKVLRQAIESDALLYIIDVREPLLGKYHDEVEILSKAGKPIIPVFNFIAGNSASLARWREQMVRFHLHAALEFDTVAFDFEAEKRLYQKLQSLLEQHYDSLQVLIDYRREVWGSLTHAAAQRIFRLLREVACYRREIDIKSSINEGEIGSLQNFVRDAEQMALRDLLKIFEFTQLDIDLQKIPVRDGQWELDIFSPHTIKTFGLNAGETALKGAAAGAGIDLMVGGISLGAAAIMGAAIGAGWATLRRYQQEIIAAMRGHKWLCADDNTLTLLFLRQRQLLHSLTRRGHAAQNTLQITDDAERTLPRKWLKVINILRQNPQWQRASTSR